MSKNIHSLKFVMALASVLIFSGCSLLPSFGSNNHTYNSYNHRPVNECTYNVQSCMYEGPYEIGERQFALEEARRLNAESLARLRRNSIDLY